MPTIKDVAKLASVSTATVSAVLNGTAYVSPQLKDRVERAVDELGYTHGRGRAQPQERRDQPDRVDRRRYDRALLYVAGGRDFVGGLRQGIFSAALPNRPRRRHRAQISFAAQKSSRWRDHLVADRSRRRLPGRGVPASSRPRSFSSTASSRPSVPTTACSSTIAPAGLQATNYLLDLGHRRIALIVGADFSCRRASGAEGYEEAFRRRGLTIDPWLIRNGNFRDAEAFAECQRLLAADRSVSAILVGSDQMFIGVMRTLHHLGLACPGGLSIATIDDFPLAGVFNRA